MSTAERTDRAVLEMESTERQEEENMHYMRITQGGKMKHWVEFALKLFADHPGKQLVLHTMPTSNRAPMKAKESLQANGSMESEDLAKINSQRRGTEGKEASSPSEVKTRRSALDTCSETIPKLISVVEIIKREYFKSLTPGDGVTGLHQYNFLGTIDDWEEHDTNNGDVNDDERRLKEITAALEGKKHLKVTKKPFMKVVLCTTSIPTIEATFTYQAPQTKKPSRAARSRKRKREKAGEVDANQDTDPS